MKKYTLYAIGEIVLVVLGILIALQINNWNESRKDDLQAISFLKTIQSNLISDLGQLDENENFLNEYEKMGFNIWNYLYGDINLVDTSTLHFDYLQLCLQREFSPTRTAYDNVVSSGNINLIKDNELQELLANFYKDDRFRNYAQVQRNKVENLYYDIRFDYIDPLMHRAQLSYRLLNDDTVDLKKYKIDWESLRKDSSYKKILGRILALRIPSRTVINNQRGQIKRINTVIDSELSKTTIK